MITSASVTTMAPRIDEMPDCVTGEVIGPPALHVRPSVGRRLVALLAAIAPIAILAAAGAVASFTVQAVRAPSTVEAACNGWPSSGGVPPTGHDYVDFTSGSGSWSNGHVRVKLPTSYTCSSWIRTFTYNAMSTITGAHWYWLRIMTTAGGTTNCNYAGSGTTDYMMADGCGNGDFSVISGAGVSQNTTYTNFGVGYASCSTDYGAHVGWTSNATPGANCGSPATRIPDGSPPKFDWTAPTNPTVTITPGANAVVSGTTVYVNASVASSLTSAGSGSTDSGGSTLAGYSHTLTGTTTGWSPLSSTTTSQVFSWTTALTDGQSTTLTVRGRDVAGNSSSGTVRTLIADKSLPTLSFTDPGVPLIVQNVTTYTTKINVSDTGSGIQSWALAREWSTAVADTCGTTWTGEGNVATGTTAVTAQTTAQSSLVNGRAYHWIITATDKVGHVTTSPASGCVVIDTTAPAAPSTPDLIAASDSGSSNTDNITSVTIPTFSGTAEAGATVTVYADGVAVGTGTAIGGNWSITTSTLSAASHSITAIAADAAANTGNPSGALSILVDGDNPTVVAVINQGALKSSSTTVEVEIDATDVTSDVVLLEASNDGSTYSTVGGSTPVWTLTTGNATKTVWVRATDTAGRTAVTSDTITLDTALAAVALDRTSVSVSVERGTLHRELVNATPSQTLFGATLDASSGLAGIVGPLAPTGAFEAMDEVKLLASIDIDVPTSATLGLHSGTVTLRSSGGTALATVSVSVTVTDPPANIVPTTLSTASSSREVVDADGDRVVVDTVNVGLAAGTPNPSQRILAIAAAHGGVVRGSIAATQIYQVQVPNTASAAALEALRLSIAAEANVSFASASYDGTLNDVVPNDPEWQDAWDQSNPAGRNWSMELIKMLTAWQFQTGDPSIPVAIVDSGIDLDHPDLAPNKTIYNTDFGKRNGNEQHGTHVAGIACAKGNNAIGVTGVAWNCSLRGYEVGFGAQKPEAVVAAMQQAAADGARVVNLSLGYAYHNATCGNDHPQKLAPITAMFRQTIQMVAAQGHDVLWVVAAGNTPCDAMLSTPGNLSDEFSNVITVGSADDHAVLSDFSSLGSAVDVAAAGGRSPGFLGLGALNVFSTFPVNCGIFGNFCENYGFLAGTSMATPQVTGLAALVMSSHPTFTAAQVKDCIVAGANANGTAIAGQAFHVLDAPSAVTCGSEVVVATDTQWKTLELSWSGGTTNAEPGGWQVNGFNDSSWSPAYIPPDPYPAWVDIPGADWLSSTGRANGHLTSEVWIARRQFSINHAITGGATINWNVDNAASIWINGNLLTSNSGTWSSVTATFIPANFLQQGTNTIAIEVFQDGAANDWSVNPTFFQAKVTIP